MTKTEKKSFHETVASLLETKLALYKERTLDRITCQEIYTTIFDTFVGVFKGAKAELTNEAVNYVAQQYYDGVLINGRQELDPNIFTIRAQLSNIHTKELAFLVTLLNGTDFAVPVLQEIRKRS